MSTRFLAVISSLLIGLIFIVPGTLLYGQDEHPETEDAHHVTVEAHQDETGHSEAAEEEFDATEYILEHISDSHDWHILTKKDGHHVSVPLPVILYSKHSGLHVFMSSKIAHGHSHDGFQMGHGTIEVINKKGETVEKSLNGKIIEVDEHGALVEAGLPLDFSITKNVFMMMLSVIILLWVFLSLARAYKKMGISEPKGLAGFIEPVIIFIEEDVAIPNIGEEKYMRFMPYLLTVFFFILLNNLMGLIPFFPFGANVTGNIAVTMVLAVITFLITQFSSNKGHWQHVFNTPGVPVWLAPIMIPVELIGLITKPFALMIRLFANITAGHIIVLSLISMIFIFKSIFIAAPSMLMVLFMDMIELLVAFLQAYIFTLLSALFIGMAMPEHHHD
ncbi:MAG: ATP synthase F0 subunit A [Bacteroidetes bacterium]|nr:MAG: ATP synthase F0 subunit A [Bacteroidota bacterium]RLD96134.1 MAG: ATP synthase F0 subunit A [Bacteroidota bacterium]